MELRQLQHFLVATQSGSLRAAADAIGISQPALTKSIHRLEAALGVQLFERHARGIRLTAFGEAMMLHARSLEAELRLTAETMRELRSTARGLVRLGAGPSMGAALLPRVTARLMADGAAIRLQIRSGLNDSLLAALHAGELDFAITTMPAGPLSGLVHERLFSDQVVVAGHARHPLAGGGATMADLGAARWIMPNPNVLTRVRLAELFGEHGLSAPNIWIETDSFPYLLEVLAHTDLLSYVPAQLMTGHDLAVIDVPGAVWRRTVSLSYWRRRTATPASRLFLSLLQEVARELHGS